MESGGGAENDWTRRVDAMIQVLQASSSENNLCVLRPPACATNCAAVEGGDGRGGAENTMSRREV